MLRTFATVALAASLCAQSPSTDVAVGVFPFLVGNMDPRINEIANNCQLHGIDTLYVSAFRATGPLTGDLWVTDSAGDWNPAWGAVRSTGAGIHLQNLITACHNVNVRVVAVLKCFADTVQPDNVAHRQYLLDVIDYFVDAWQSNGQPVYDLDGIALDYVRYVGGTNVNAANVTNFVSDVRQRIGNLSLHAYLLANRFSFDGPTYNGMFNSYSATMSTLTSQFGQSWQQLAPLVDVMMPMAYTANGSIYNSYALHQAYVRKTAEYARQACTAAGVPTRRVQPTIKTYTGEGETTTDLTIEASITGALLGGGDGYQAFRYQFLVNNPSWWTKMAQYAVPGCNWPRPVYTALSPRLTTTFDPTASVDSDQGGNSLQMRYDFDQDGSFDTGWLPAAAAQNLVRHPGQWRSTMQVRDSDGHVSITRPALPGRLGGDVAAAVRQHVARWSGADPARRRRGRRRARIPGDRRHLGHQPGLRLAAGIPGRPERRRGDVAVRRRPERRVADQRLRQLRPERTRHRGADDPAVRAAVPDRAADLVELPQPDAGRTAALCR